MMGGSFFMIRVFRFIIEGGLKEGAFHEYIST